MLHRFELTIVRDGTMATEDHSFFLIVVHYKMCSFRIYIPADRLHIQGSGHTVPEYKSTEALAFFRRFLAAKLL